MVRRVIAGTPQPLAGVTPIMRYCWQWRDRIASNRDLRPIRFTFTVDRPLWLIKNRLNPERSRLSALVTTTVAGVLTFFSGLYLYYF